MYKIILTGFIVILFVCSSCKKVLDNIQRQDFVTPETFFNKEADATAALNAGWDMLTRQWMFGGYWQYRALAADDVYCVLTGSFPANFGITSSESGAIPFIWNNLYTTIQYTNVLLDNIDDIEMDAGRRGAIKGEGLFLRAFCYFLLVDQWGAVPLRLTATAGTNDVHIAATPVKEIYAQILKDMTEAEELVPTTANALYGGAGYAARTTVQGMLARVCLTMAGEPLKDVARYKDARDWAKKVVDSKEHALNPDYTDIFIRLAANQFDKKEILWEVDFNDLPGTSDFGYIGYLNGIPGAAPSFGSSVGQVRITRKLYNTYGTAANIKDVRRDWNCSPFVYKNTTTTGSDVDKTFFTATQLYDRYDSKYRLQYTPAPRTTGRTGINFPILRYSDVLLMLAEAENALNSGPTALAYSMVNQVRARAWGKLMPGATLLNEADVATTYNQASFLQLVQDERMRELSSEAIRKHDLIRWGIYVSSMKAIAADVNDASLPSVNGSVKPQLLSMGTLVSNRDLLWPIPATELTFNNLLKQNPGW
jgi:hypothetical protein